ncbi:MAG: prolyl oligopeptidase family serine peptidase, partial [Bacteroidaceae bacterium]|nr:prolyl oligopeptidase family serine peptidase [Bacteroidaceae bacterium]
VDEGAYAHLDFSRDQFVLLSERDGFQHLYLYTTGGQLVRQLTAGEFEVTAYYGTDATGKNFYYASNEGSPLEQYIYKVDASGKRTKLSQEKGHHAAIFSKGCQYYLNTYSSLATPPVYTLCNAVGKVLKTVEDNAELKAQLAALPLGEAEIISLTTADGIQLNGWMVKPADFNPAKKYPVLMYQYSGPGSQQVHNAYGNGFMGGLIWEHHLAEKGYIVVCVDGRGTGGRGSDFKRCTYLKLGDLESHDQVETAVWLSKLPYVDKDRIAIWGWSFGGFNTLMAMCEGRGVFRCGVAVAPVTDWRFYDSVYTERFMRTPQENPVGYDCSPLHRYQNLKGDLLLVHGTADDNVHYQNTVEFSEALVQADFQFDTQIYTNRNHSIYGGNTRRHLIARIESFLDSHLLP